jgi:hypothetical protein
MDVMVAWTMGARMIVVEAAMVIAVIAMAKDDVVMRTSSSPPL